MVAEEQKLKHLQQGFGGIKEILLTNKIEHFLRRYHQPNKISGLMRKREYIFQYVPKLGVEIIAVFGLVGMCLFLILEGKPYREVTHMLGLMATAGFRMIPSFSRILNNLQAIRYGWVSVDALEKEFKYNYEESKNDRPYPSSSFSFLKDIELSNVSFTYSPNRPEILSHLNFITIPKGQLLELMEKVDR